MLTDTKNSLKSRDLPFEVFTQNLGEALVIISCESGFPVFENIEFKKQFPNFSKNLQKFGLIELSKKTQLPRGLSKELLREDGTYDEVQLPFEDQKVAEVICRKVTQASDSFWVIMIRDTTPRKELEQELVKKHEELHEIYLKLENTVAELKATQESLVQSGKMAALGELAAGIAHELNQPLLAIRGYSQEIEATQEELNPSAKDSLKEIISNADKMAKIISYLRTFVRKSNEQQEWVDVHVAIEEAFKLLGKQLASKGIEIHREFSNPLPKVFANALHLEQIIINLASNARDAIESTGRGKGNIKVVTFDSGSFVEIRFSDDGCGMSEKTRSKMFNPFFTTKEVGKGMGLGMSISYGIIQKLHGSIVVSSEEGRGTEFKIRIPKEYRDLG